MDRSDHEFTYKRGVGMLTLLGVLMLILGPLALWMYSQTGPITTWGHLKRVPFVPDAYQLPAAGVLLILLGGVTVYSGLRSGSRRARIRFTEDRVVLVNPSFGSTDLTVRYDHIKEIVVSQGKQGKILSFRHPQGQFRIASGGMTSMSDFEAVCALLQERASPAISA